MSQDFDSSVKYFKKLIEIVIEFYDTRLLHCETQSNSVLKWAVLKVANILQKIFLSFICGNKKCKRYVRNWPSKVEQYTFNRTSTVLYAMQNASVLWMMFRTYYHCCRLSIQKIRMVSNIVFTAIRFVIIRSRRKGCQGSLPVSPPCFKLHGMHCLTL